jgi:hypothetical protein
MTPEALATYKKDPAEVLDYSIDWTQWMASADTIANSGASTWALHADAPSGLTLSGAAVSGSLLIATVFVSGGRIGENYTLTNTITTLQGRTKVASILIQIEDR